METTLCDSVSTESPKKESLTINKIANGFTISFGYGALNLKYYQTIEDAMNNAKEYFAL